MFNTKHILAMLAAGALSASTGVALSAGDNVTIDPPAQGSVSKEDGLAAFARIFEVASHPRCSNCHTGPSDRPMWSGPSYGETSVHGMNIRAGESRDGTDFIPCLSCHAEDTREQINEHEAPKVGAAWRLAPVEAFWFGQDAETICKQLRDPELTDGRDIMGLAEHLDHDVILHWAWNPGPGREPAPYSLQEHVNDLLAWGAAGTPCPGE